MKEVFLVMSILFLFGGAASAENNGLAVDAQSRGYSFEITDVVFGSNGLTLFTPGIRVALSNVLKGGKPIAAANATVILGRDGNVRAQGTEICNDMFGTANRLRDYAISGVGYSYQGHINTLECLFTERQK